MNQENDSPISASEEKVHELVAEFHRLEDQGKAVSPADFAARHPEHADALKSYFDGVAVVDQMSDPPPAPEQTFITGNTQAVGNDQTMIEDSESVADHQRVSADAPPTKFGRYKILSELGRGAMGAVYLAQDEQLDRKVALKIPQFGGALNKGLLERFYREARAAGNLRHPGICPVYDVGEIDGQHFITMAFIEGRPLRDFSKSSKRQADKQTARVIRKIAMAMAEAHDQNVIHRDLKPANIMIDTKNEPVVMDFGLARRAAENEEKLTHTGTVIGTPAYMSPEQVDGDNENVGPPADIYSLGVVFYELLTGELPFKGNLMSILKQISMKQPRPPVELHSDVDPFLQDLCLNMLEKDAKDRPESMHEVAKTLSEWLQGLHAPTDESGMLETSRVPGQKKNKAPALEATDAMTTPGVPRIEPQREEFPAVEEFPVVVDTEMSATTVTPSRVVSSAARRPGKNKKLLPIGGLGGAALLLAGIAFFINLGGKYNVKIIVDDPSISLKVDGDDVLIDGAGSQIRLSAGPHTLKMERDGLEAELEEFTVTKDGKNLVHVAVINGRFAINPPDQPDVNTTLPSGPSGTDYALQFDGVSSHVVIPEAMFEDLDKFTIELTIDTAEKRDEESFGPMFTAVHSDRRRIRFSDGSRRGMIIREDQQQYRVGVEYESGRIQVAGVFDGSELRVYQDGQLIGKAAAGGRGVAHTGKPHAFIGAGMNDARVGPPIKDAFLGTIDEVRISRVPRYDADYQPQARLKSDEDTVALYHFDEGQGDVLKDSSGNDHHGKIVGAKWVRLGSVSQPTPPVYAGSNYALQIKRVPEGMPKEEHLSQVEIPSFKDTTPSLTMELWISGQTRPEEPLSPHIGAHVNLMRTHPSHGIGGSSGATYSYKYGKDKSRDDLEMIALSKQEMQVVGPVVHLAAVRDANKEEVRFYMNGRLFGRRPTDSVVWQQGQLLLGGGYDQFNGWMDEARISSVARYEENFTPARRFESDEHTLALYHFDEGQGNVLKDSSGNDHHGKITGASWVRVGGLPPSSSSLPGEPVLTERELAEYILSLGKETALATNVEGVHVRYKSASDLPDEPFHVIWVSSTALSDADVPRLRTAEHLEFLGMALSSVSDAGLKHIADFPRLRGMHLHKTNITDVGMEHLSRSRTLNNLTLSENAITDDGLRFLERMTHLKEVHVQRTRATAEGVARLQTALPECKIVSDFTIDGDPAPLPAVAPFDEAQAKAHQKAWADHLGLPVEKEVALPGNAKMTFMLIPPGEFMMGSSAREQQRFLDETKAENGPPDHTLKIRTEGPQRRVRISQPYYLSKTETTQAQWQAILGNNPSKLASVGHPVNRVSWIDIQTLLKEINKQNSTLGTRFTLPTEAQWEHACRAGTTTAWFTGNDVEGLEKYSWFGANQLPEAVGQLAANPWGLHDMLGNVVEWCADFEALYRPSADVVIDPTGPTTKQDGRVFRGGSRAEPARLCRSASRGGFPPDFVGAHFGFRLVMTIDTAKLMSAQTTRVWDTPEFQKWVAQVAGLSAEKQVEAVARKLQELNPGFDGVVTHEIQNGIVTRLEFLTDSVTDISPVRALTGLTQLRAYGSKGRSGKLSDLSPLQGLQLDFLAIDNNPVTDLSPLHDVPLKNLEMHYTQVADLSPLRGKELGYLVCADSKITDLSPLTGMPLRRLQIEGTQVSSLSLLKGMPLELLFCSRLNISDLSPLQGMPLTQLRLFNTQVNDLSPLKGMPLRILETAKSKVTDLSPLRELPLEELICDFSVERDTTTLRSIRTLKTINGKPVAEFWKEVEGNDTGKAPPPAVAPFDEAQAKAHQKAWADYLGLPVEKEVELPGGEKMPFMLIPAGEFMMGSTDDEKKHFIDLGGLSESLQEVIQSEMNSVPTVIRQPFYLARVEVTQGQWEALTGSLPSELPDREKNVENPINLVSWEDIQKLLKEMNEKTSQANMTFVLPTEEQWEYACRAGTTTYWYCGNDESRLSEFAWVGQNQKPATVAQLKPNAWNLFDMHGNAAEVCARPGEFRGGHRANKPSFARSAFIARLPSDRRGGFYGFRLAMTIDIAKVKPSWTPPPNPNRVAAEWALRTSESVGTSLGEFEPANQLPDRDFVVTAIRGAKAADEDLERLRGLTALKRLVVGGKQITDRGLVHLEQLKQLTVLGVVGSNVSDAGLVHLNGLKRLHQLELIANKELNGTGFQHLTELNLTALHCNISSITDEGLQHLKSMTQLVQLQLMRTEVTDAGLKHLNGLVNLQEIKLQGTKVTAAGVAELQKALPDCKIEWDGM